MTKDHKHILQASTLLLVNDDLDLRKNLYKLLECYVGTIYEASDGIEALEQYDKYHPSFIITDIRMPNMNGLDLIKNIRSKDFDTPIVVFSAYTDTQYLLDAIKLNLIDYLVAPIVYDVLIKTLDTVAVNISNNILLKPIKFNNCKYDPINKTIFYDEIENHLTISETKILELLLMHRGNLVTKNMIEDKLYDDYKILNDNSLKNFIFKIRKKLPPNSIITVESLGYKID